VSGPAGRPFVHPAAPGEIDALRLAVERWAAARPSHHLSPSAQVDAAMDAFRRTAADGPGEVLLAGDAAAGALGGWAPLAWDSEVLGVAAGRCTSPVWWGDGETALAALTADAVRRADQSGIDLLFLRTDARDAALPRLLAREGFWLADSLVTFALGLEGTEAGDAEMEHARAADLPALRTIACAFRTGHFHADPRIGRERADGLYVRWVENSLAGRADAFLVVRGGDGGPLGFITCRVGAADAESAPHGVIELVAVDPQAQGQRVGQRLVAAALRWFAQAGAASVEVGTQVDNLAAVRLYQRAGFQCAAFSHTFHRWAAR
jgi:dTDP-4-amino-4,6-dideoxy-D-galactose acyltransferase